MTTSGQRPTSKKWWARLHRWIFGVWPQRVVDERLAEDDTNRHIRYEQALQAFRASDEGVSTLPHGQCHDCGATLFRNRDGELEPVCGCGAFNGR